MFERYTCERVVFARNGDQAAFLNKVKKKLNLTWSNLAGLLNLHPRTIRDWSRGKNCMPHYAAKLFAQRAALKLPQNVKIKIWREHLSRAGTIGGRTLVRKHGGRVAADEIYRMEKWREWWNQIGRHRPSPIHNTPKFVRQPKLSEEVAEFVGIMLGDGGMTKYQLKITHHRYDDRLHSEYIVNLIKKLFRVSASITQHRGFMADDIVVSRVKLVEYCVNRLGLVMGNKIKQKIDIPVWIKRSKKYSIACVRTRSPLGEI